MTPACSRLSALPSLSHAQTFQKHSIREPSCFPAYSIWAVRLLLTHSRIPQVRLVLCQQCGARCHKYPIGYLARSAPIALEHPAQSRLDNIYAHRVMEIFASQICSLSSGWSSIHCLLVSLIISLSEGP